jgi:hypothetical protein
MADSQIEFYGRFTNGNPFSFKCLAAANGAAGTYCPCRLKGTAVSTDSVDLRVPDNVIINDIISSCASGAIRIESNGEDTYALISLAARGATNAGRAQNLGIPLAAGKNYRVKVDVVLPA